MNELRRRAGINSGDGVEHFAGQWHRVNAAHLRVVRWDRRDRLVEIEIGQSRVSASSPGRTNTRGSSKEQNASRIASEVKASKSEKNGHLFDVSRRFQTFRW
jgi:hypothetical protein